jgi:hypothetical protein
MHRPEVSSAHISALGLTLIRGLLSLVQLTLYHTLARLFRPQAPQYVLHETGLDDIVAIHGLLFPMPRLDSKGVRMLIQ